MKVQSFILLLVIVGLLISIVLILKWEIYPSILHRADTSFPLAVKWQASLDGSSYESPVYWDGLVLFPTNSVFQNYWYALDINTGQIIWSQLVKGRYSFYRCLTGQYLVTSGPWSLTVLKPKTGEVVWQKSSGDTASCSEDQVYTTGKRGLLIALGMTTGQQLWIGTIPRKNFSSLVFNAATAQIIALEDVLDGDFYVIDPQSKKLQSSFEQVGYLPFGAVWERGVDYLISDGRLYIGGTVLDLRTGKVIHEDEHYTPFQPALSGDTMYLSTIEGIVALDRGGYKLKWIYQPSPEFLSIPAIPLSRVTIIEDVAYAIFSDATLRAFDTKTGQQIGYWQPSKDNLAGWPASCIFLPSSNLCTRSAGVGLTSIKDTLLVSFGDGTLYALVN